MRELDTFLQRQNHGGEGVEPTVRVQLTRLRDALENTR